MNTNTVSSVSTISSVKAPGSSGDQDGTNSDNNVPPPKRIMPNLSKAKATFPRVKMSIEEVWMLCSSIFSIVQCYLQTY